MATTTKVGPWWFSHESCVRYLWVDRSGPGYVHAYRITLTPTCLAAVRLTNACNPDTKLVTLLVDYKTYAAPEAPAPGDLERLLTLVSRTEAEADATILALMEAVDAAETDWGLLDGLFPDKAHLISYHAGIPSV